jgi:hypothetical protein
MSESSLNYSTRVGDHHSMTGSKAHPRAVTPGNWLPRRATRRTKSGRRSVELVLAAVAGTRQEQISEAADLMFHFQVLLAVLDLSLADVADCLERRHRG